MTAEILFLAVDAYAEKVEKEETAKKFRYDATNFFGAGDKKGYCMKYLPEPEAAKPEPAEEGQEEASEKTTGLDAEELRQMAIDAPGKEVWGKVLAELKETVDAENFNTWLQSTEFLGIRDGVLSLGVPSAFNRSWLTRNFQDQISETAERIHGAPVGVAFHVMPLDEEEG